MIQTKSLLIYLAAISLEAKKLCYDQAISCSTVVHQGTIITKKAAMAKLFLV